MELLNLLAGIEPISLFGQTFDVSLNWIGRLISWLIKGVGTVGIGIIIFSLCLKLVVLPFDVYQRISMRKQNQKMKEQKERMEKLQKQYANDKQMYNQKLMEMYKENGISMFSSCLPMILSMVIFIVAINAFNAYAQYSAVDNYNQMVGAYQTAIQAYCPDLDDDNVSFGENTIIIKGVGEDDKNAYLYYEIPNSNALTAETDKETLHAYINEYLNNNTVKCYVDADKVKNGAIWTEIQATLSENADETATANAIRNYFIGKGQKAVSAYYTAENGVGSQTKFLWIKNIWMTDASYKHPVCDYETFEMEAKREEFRVGGDDVSYSKIGEKTDVYTKTAYDTITGGLTVQKGQANGYFILIALSIGTILLQQFVTMRSQKEQQQFSTVDGQGASQQKMMIVMMTGMFAIFSFMYSSAFSIYMITSNIFSLLSTLIINKVVDMKLDKEANTVTTAKMDNRRLSRIEAAKQAGKASAQTSKEKKNKEE